MPQLDGATWLLEAFYELSTTRSYTMGGAANIPIDKVWGWADRFDAPLWFSDAIKVIDSRYLELSNGDGSNKRQ